MRITFTVEVDIDASVFGREGQRHGLSLQRSRDSFVADLECRLNDAVRWRDGVDAVGVRLAMAPEQVAQDALEPAIH